MLKKKSLLQIDNSFQKRIICEFAEDGFDELIRLGYVHKTRVNGDLSMHTHEKCIEFTYHLNGAQVYRIAHENGTKCDYKISGGDIFITYPGELHGSGSYTEDVSKFYYFIIKIEDLTGRFLNLSDSERNYVVDLFMSRKPRHKKAPPSFQAELENIISIYKCNEIKPIDKVLILNATLKILLDILDYNDIKNKDENEDMYEIKKYIDENIDCKFYISDLAQKCRLSDSRFIHKFKHSIGMSPMEYIIRAKIDKATTLLSEEKSVVTDVAMQLNFSSCSYFSMMYKRYTGISPRMVKEK